MKCNENCLKLITMMSFIQS